MSDAELPKDLFKAIAGTLGAFVGGMLMRWGRRARKDREEPRLPRDQQLRPIEHGEWEELRDDVRDLRHDLEELAKDHSHLEGKVDRDHERIGNMVLKVSMVEERLNMLSDHCDHCPGHGGGRR